MRGRERERDGQVGERGEEGRKWEREMKIYRKRENVTKERKRECR